MRLGTKTVLLTGSLMLALVAVLNAVAGYVVRRSFSDLEKNHVKQDIERVRRAIDTQKEYLSVAVADWTTWDALYRYAEDRNEEFAAENFGIDAFRALKVDLVSLVDPAGVPIWQGFLDVDGSWHSMLPLGLRKLAAPSSPLADLDEKTCNPNAIMSSPAKARMSA
jgi:sensor domain CHASE-containing protein